MGVRFAASIIAMAFLSQACHSAKVDETPGTAASPSPDVVSTGGPSVNTDADQIALGEKIFHGKVAGGTCAGCHGQQGKGTGVAPDLSDSEWLDADGSLQSIAAIITAGVPKPKKHDSAMPPKGGSNLSDEQVNAVAAYVFSLSHK